MQPLTFTTGVHKRIQIQARRAELYDLTVELYDNEIHYSVLQPANKEGAVDWADMWLVGRTSPQ